MFDERVCVWFDINCVYCYNFEGLVCMLGFDLCYVQINLMQWGVDKFFVVVGCGFGDCFVDIVFGDFDGFIFFYCFELFDFGEMMLEFGCLMVYVESVLLI